MNVNLDAIKALRDKTSASLNDVRQALASAGGDEAKALEFLRQRGADIAQKRSARATGQGRVEAYVHHDGKLGALVEVQCETDFVARTADFVQFCRDVAMHVAAMAPRYVRRDEVPSGAVGADGAVLLEQPYVKDPATTVADLANTLVAKTGEHVVIKRFTRFGVGDTA